MSSAVHDINIYKGELKRLEITFESSGDNNELKLHSRFDNLGQHLF
jgi:hypothetical protein